MNCNMSKETAIKYSLILPHFRTIVMIAQTDIPFLQFALQIENLLKNKAPMIIPKA